MLLQIDIFDMFLHSRILSRHVAGIIIGLSTTMRNVDFLYIQEIQKHSYRSRMCGGP